MKKLFVFIGLLMLLSACNDQQSEVVSTQSTEKEQPKKVYSLADVAEHSSSSNCWSIIDNQVYDLTLYVSKHPGGADKIESICGKDGSEDFHGKHGEKPQMKLILAAFKVGDLAK